MSRIGLLADVHGNLVALRTVLERLRGTDATSWICAGDLVGYGAMPDECVEEVRALPELTLVAGNHDLLAIGRLDAGRHSPSVQRSTRWTRERIGYETRAVLERLPLRATCRQGVTVAHGSLDDSEVYVRDAAAAEAQRRQLREEDPGALALVLGHTHLPLVHGAGPLVVNPGAVGQSRERRLQARGALLDPATWDVELVAVDYDVGAARAAQRRAGLPEEFLHMHPPTVLVRGLRRLARAAGRR